MQRIPIMSTAPVIEHGRFAAKATVGESFQVSATVFREGHDELACEVVATDPTGVRRAPVAMTLQGCGVSQYAATLTPDVMGAWTFEVRAWSDPLATWLHHTEVKVPVGVDVELMFAEGSLLLDRIIAEHTLTAGDLVTIDNTRAGMCDQLRPIRARLAVALGHEIKEIFSRYPLRDLLSVDGPYPFFADRTRALFGSWYEFFPRSEGAKRSKSGVVTSGTFKTAAKRLPAVAAMGFDVLYLPPIHPIGEVNRKGPNNTLTPAPTDVGSPWAIGSAQGGHDAVHPDLGTLKDFDDFVRRANKLGIEVALDLALQAAPDHPWATSNPEWFTTRADGTIAYAENPPKKYQDIYPINFDNDPEGIYQEVLRIVRHWMSHGVRIFRVDNPHTKPVAFWERLLGEIRSTDPDVLFLSEAFTKPPMMHALGAVGFHQSYTYFTWRTGKEELGEYLTEVAHQSSHLMRPNFFVNTPDILHAYLQYGGPAAFKIRAVLAACGSPSWGVYAGFDLFEHVAVKPGSEEYLDSEKYQIRIRDWAGAQAEGTSLAPYLTVLNQIRRDQPALQQLRNLQVHETDNDAVLCFSKTAGDNTVIVVVNLDPHSPRETMVHLDLPAIGANWGDTLMVHDELSGETWHWGQHNYVRLDPHVEPAHILVVRHP